MSLSIAIEKETKNFKFKVMKDNSVYEGTLRIANNTIRNNADIIKNYFVGTYNHSDTSKEVLEDFFIKCATNYFYSYSVPVSKKVEILHNVSDQIYSYLLSILKVDKWYENTNTKKDEVPYEMLDKIVKYISSIILSSIIFDSYRNLAIKMFEKHQDAIEFLRSYIISKTLKLNSFSEFYFYNLHTRDESDVVTKTLNFINMMYAIIITKNLHEVDNFFGFLLTMYKKSLENYERTYMSIPVRPSVTDEVDISDDIVTYLNTELSMRHFVKSQSTLFSIKQTTNEGKQLFNIFSHYKEYVPTYITFLVNNMLENLNFSRSVLERYGVLTQYYLTIALKNVNLHAVYNIQTPLRALRYVTKVDTSKITISEKNKIVTGIMNDLQKHYDSVLKYYHHIEKLGKITLKQKVFLDDLVTGKPVVDSENRVRAIVEFMKFYILFMESKEVRELVLNGIYKNNLVPDPRSLHILLDETKKKL